MIGKGTPKGSSIGDGGKKYTILRDTIKEFNIPEIGHTFLYRIKALRDIPGWSVKAGDIGGWVRSYDSLSHDGDAWIGENAKVCINVRVEEDALVTDEAVVYSTNTSDQSTSAEYLVHGFQPKVRVAGRVIISGSASVIDVFEVMDDAFITGESTVKRGRVAKSASIKESATVTDSIVIDNAVIQGTAVVEASTVAGDTLIEGKANVTLSSFSAINHVFGNAKIGPHQKVRLLKTNGIFKSSIDSADFFGDHLALSQDKPKRKVMGFSDVMGFLKKKNYDQAELEKTRLQGFLELQAKAKYSDARQQLVEQQEEYWKQEKLMFENEAKLNALMSQKVVEEEQDNLLESAVLTIEAEYNAYSHDIVNLIKYPLMTDSTFEPVGKFLQKLRKAKRHMSTMSRTPLTEEMVDDLETAYLAMESACIKESTKGLDDADKKRLTTASKMVQLALNEGAAEHEKKVSAKKALDYLDGIVLLPEQAVESFRVKAGLKELTAG